MGSAGTGSCSQDEAKLREISLSQIRHGGKSKLQLQAWIFPFSYKLGKAGDKCSTALSIDILWKGLQNLWEATWSRIWEELAQGRQRSEQGGCSCLPAGVLWVGQVSMILLDNCHVHHGTRPQWEWERLCPLPVSCQPSHPEGTANIPLTPDTTSAFQTCHFQAGGKAGWKRSLTILGKAKQNKYTPAPWESLEAFFPYSQGKRAQKKRIWGVWAKISR